MASISLTDTRATTAKGTTKLDLVSSGTGIDSSIFAIEYLPAAAVTSEPDYFFSHICSPSELVEFPSTASTASAYFRASSVTMIFDTPTMCDAVVKCIKEDVAKLVREYNSLPNAGTVTTVYDIE